VFVQPACDGFNAHRARPTVALAEQFEHQADDFGLNQINGEAFFRFCATLLGFNHGVAIRSFRAIPEALPGVLMGEALDAACKKLFTILTPDTREAIAVRIFDAAISSNGKINIGDTQIWTLRKSASSTPAESRCAKSGHALGRLAFFLGAKQFNAGPEL
jgi:hypothetical protein